jgi:predicted AAA+ superfamily ATPase
MVNISEWASVTSASRTTVMRYVEIAEQAHLLNLLPPFSGGRRAEVTGASKICFLDNGVRNVLYGGFMPSKLRGDGNALWQNAVYGELRKRLPAGSDIRYWRSRNGAEVDFMVSTGERMLAIEVRSRPQREAKLTRGVRGFLEIYRPDCLGVINRTVREDLVDNDVDVRFRRPWELDELLEVVRS